MAYITAPKIKCIDCAKLALHPDSNKHAMQGTCPKRPGKMLWFNTERYCVSFDPKKKES